MTRKIWSRVVEPKHEYEVDATAFKEGEALLKELSENIVFMPHVSRTAKKMNIPVSTIHDNIKRLDVHHGITVKVIVGKKRR